jgi:hypothetical protein
MGAYRFASYRGEGAPVQFSPRAKHKEIYQC